MNDTAFLDGNAAAGDLREVFSVDLTTASGQCAACGHVAALADTRVYAFAPGIIIRCTGCSHPLVRMVKTETSAWLDMRGLVFLQLQLPEAGAV